MRADAQRNTNKLRKAAVELFRERDLQAPLKEIARRAGVSHGALYIEDLCCIFGVNGPVARAAADVAPTPGAAASPSCSTACAPKPPTHSPPIR